MVFRVPAAGRHAAQQSVGSHGIGRDRRGGPPRVTVVTGILWASVGWVTILGIDSKSYDFWIMVT